MNNLYDTVIIGSGSAGSIIANRLSKDESRNILLIEAGNDYPVKDSLPENVFYGHGNLKTNASYDTDPSNWSYRAESTKGGPTIKIPRGKIIGGSSSINAQIFLRGIRDDYDRWAEFGNDKWTFEEVLPYFLKLEGKPYQGLIQGSVNLFHKLVTSGSRFRLLGLDGVPVSDTTLIEVYPGGAWKILSKGNLPAKRTVSGRYRRAELLTELGVKFASSDLPTNDQLDATLAAWVAYKFWIGESSIEGTAPEMDELNSIIREGYIVMPTLSSGEVHNDTEEVAPV